MVTKDQIERMKQLRGNGWTYAQIAEEMGLKPSTVAYNIKKGADAPAPLPKAVKIIHAKESPTGSILTLDTNDFESLRDDKLIYAVGQDLYEMRSNGAIHKTTLPMEIKPSFYPEIADIIATHATFTPLLDHENHISHIKSLLENRGVQRIVKRVILSLLSKYNLREQENQNQISHFLQAMRELVAKLIVSELNELVETFHPEMPPVQEVVGLIRYLAENNMLGEHFDEPDKTLIKLASDNLETSFYAEIMSGKWDQANPDSIESGAKIAVKALSKLGFDEADIEICLRHLTIDPDEVNLLRTSGAPSIDSAKMMGAEGFTTWSDYQDHQDALDNAPIEIKLYPNLSSVKSKHNSKILDALKRENIEDSLTTSWTRFEVHARELWKQKWPHKELPMGEGSTMDLSDIIVSLVLGVGSTTSIQGVDKRGRPNTAMSLGREADRLEREFTEGRHTGTNERKVRSRINTIRTQIATVNYDEEPFSTLKIMDQAREIRNAEIHGEETELTLIMKHVRVILEVTEKIIVH